MINEKHKEKKKRKSFIEGRALKKKEVATRF